MEVVKHLQLGGLLRPACITASALPRMYNCIGAACACSWPLDVLCLAHFEQLTCPLKHLAGY